METKSKSQFGKLIFVLWMAGRGLFHTNHKREDVLKAQGDLS